MAGLDRTILGVGQLNFRQLDNTGLRGPETGIRSILSGERTQRPD